MPLTTKAKIGFIGSSAPSSPHHESFKAFIPKEIDFTFVQEENGGGSLYDARGKVDSLIGQTVALVEQHALVSLSTHPQGAHWYGTRPASQLPHDTRLRANPRRICRRVRLGPPPSRRRHTSADRLSSGHPRR